MKKDYRNPENLDINYLVNDFINSNIDYINRQSKIYLNRQLLIKYYNQDNKTIYLHYLDYDWKFEYSIIYNVKYRQIKYIKYFFIEKRISKEKYKQLIKLQSIS